VDTLFRDSARKALGTKYIKCPSPLNVFVAINLLYIDDLYSQAESLFMVNYGVIATPLAAGINVGGYYKWHFLLRNGVNKSFCL
jgi:hypothetical protein